MTEYKFENCRVRIHGDYDLDAVKTATATFMKKVERKKKNEKKNLEKSA